MTAPLALAWHITKKDLRASRDLILAGVLLMIAETLLRTVWPPLTMSLNPDVTELVNQIKNVVPVVRSLFAALLVAHLVHADPLAGNEGFWLTRPISRGTLFASKVGTILLAIVLPAILGQVAPMMAFGVPLLDVTRLLSEFLLYFAAGLLVVFAGAALTPNVRSLVAWTAALGILWAVVTILTLNVSTAPRTPPGTTQSGATTRPSHRSTMPSRTGLLVAFVLMTAGSSAAAWHQFRTRRTGRSALIAAATAAIVIGVPFMFQRARLEARDSFTNEFTVPLGAEMRFKDGPRSVVMWPVDDRDGQCGVMVRMTQVQTSLAANAPPQQSYRFAHRPTGRPLVFTYFALPDRIREMAAGQLASDSEARELFQILYRYAVVGPMFTSDDPRTTDLKSVSCRDVDVIVRH
jgi:ABC-type transport system involved in multi-copper enzyme maturation permease subunit